MREKDFIELREHEWQEFDILVSASKKIFKKGESEQELTRLPLLVKKLSVDLSLARHRVYNQQLCEDLNTRVTEGFRLLENQDTGVFIKVLYFFIYDFPQAVRKEWKLHLLTWVFVVAPVLLILLSVKISGDMEWVNSLLNDEQKMQLDSSYGKSETSLAEARGEGGNMMMFGHYIWNNISIDFQIFAGGVIGGLGSLYILFFNAIYLGAVVAYIEAYGDPSKLYGFISSHAPYELWAMMISGMAGLKVGFALLMPGRRTRIASLKHAGNTAIPLIIGAASMTFIAAIIEGFWSANDFTALGGVTFKIWIGFAGWILLSIYFIFSGRRGKHEA